MKVFLLLLGVGCVLGQHGTVIDVLQYHRMTTFINDINNAGLSDVLRGTGPFTVFAPTNHAFRRMDSDTAQRLKNDTAVLTAVVKYHIVNGSIIQTSDLKVNEKKIKSMEGHDIRINHYLFNNHIAVEGVKIFHAGLKADNGIVHELNDVMIPPVGSVIDVIANDPQFSTLKQMVESAGLTTFLQEQDPITMFAPTNDAFKALGDSVVQGLVQQPSLLTTIIKYHVVPGSLWSDDFHEQRLETFDEADRLRLHKFLFFGYDAGSSQILTKDISATNGVVHKLAKVNIPPSVQDKVNALKATAAPITN